MKQKDWVNISEASRILAVSEQALRKWTDEGKIKAFITPGGHRRYSRLELNRFINQNRKMLGLKDLVTDLEHVVPVLHDTATNYLRSTSWQGQLDPESQKYLASLGRRLLALIIKAFQRLHGRQRPLKRYRKSGLISVGFLPGRDYP